MKIEDLHLSTELHNLLQALGIKDLEMLTQFREILSGRSIAPSQVLRQLCREARGSGTYPGMGESRFAALFDAVLLHAIAASEQQGEAAPPRSDCDKSCRTCRFYFGNVGNYIEQEGGSPFGLCRRFPPVFTGEPGVSMSPHDWCLPSVDPAGLCGEWQAITAADASSASL